MTNEVIEFRVHGIPQSQGSMSAFLPPGSKHPIITHKRGKTLKAWRSDVVAAMPKGRMLYGPVGVYICFYMPIPKSRPKVLKTEKQWMEWAYPAKKPDLDKMERAILDALTGVILRDDSQVVSVTKAKIYFDPPGARIAILPLTPNGAGVPELAGGQGEVRWSSR